MSNKTQLSTNNTQLASLIQTLQGKAAGGGGSVETCTVTVTCSTSTLWKYVCTGYENGEYVPLYSSIWNGVGANTATIENVVCGSAMYFVATNGSTNTSVINGTAEFLDMFSGDFVVKAPTVGGEACTITFIPYE